MSDDISQKSTKENKMQLESKLQLECSRIREPSEVLKKILDDKRSTRLLYHAMRSQVFFLVQRGLKYEDGEISVYDKLLVKLFNEGLPMKNIGLLELFIDNYAAVKEKTSNVDKQNVVSAYLSAQEMVETAGLLPINQTRRETTARIGGPCSALAGLSIRDSKHEDFVKVESKNETALEKLIQVYHVAKADYYIADANKTGISNKSTDKFRNVRFLRDTAENLLRCLKAEAADHPIVAEVERVVAASCEHAKHLAGGRKRIFDDIKDEEDVGVRDSQRSQPGNYSSNSKGNQPPSGPKRSRRHRATDTYIGEAYRPEARHADHYRPTHALGAGRPGRPDRYDRPAHRESARHEPTEGIRHRESAEAPEQSEVQKHEVQE